jgi:hypothetical protein
MQPKPTEPNQFFALLDEKQIAEFEAFVLEIPGKFCNPILAKFHTYKRRVLPNTETAAAPEQPKETAPEKTEKKK